MLFIQRIIKEKIKYELKNKIMKSIYLTLLLALMSLSVVFGQVKTEKIKVGGKCGMCESRIERAAKSVDGVTSADWDKKTQIMEVVFDTLKTNSDKVQMAIAKVGHDTEKYKAKDETYNALPGCCKYD